MTTAASATQGAQSAIAGNATPDQFTNYTWAALVLALAGAPITSNNLNNFTTWMTAENPADNWTGEAGVNNPLNNGLGSGGGSGLGPYPDLATAAEYAAKGIAGGISGTECGGAPKGVILTALKANAPFSVFQKATISSGWAGGCYSGSDYAGLSTAAPPPQVSVTQAAKSKLTHGPTLGSVSNAIFNSTSTLQNLGATANTLTGGVAGDVANAVSSTASWTDSLGHLLSDLTEPSWWLRVGMGALGIALFGIGLAGFVSTTGPGQKATQDAGTATKEAAKTAVTAAVVA